MVHSIELLLDGARDGARDDAALRHQWEALAAAGLPSQAHHTGATNRPHVTLVACSHVDARVEPALVRATRALPLRVALGPLTCFGAGPFVLVRLVVPTADLLALQALVHQACGAATMLGPNFAAGRWVPHVTLARRLPADQVGRALASLARLGPAEVELTAARHWDGVRKAEWPVGADSPP
ncbi:MAG TPA: 2'-5' RNA ligase family protein [Dermatophilaceae bacterium]|nr:2'-5' RNA ligase family protein [Dermatophilaceae bacterium]